MSFRVLQTSVDFRPMLIEGRRFAPEGPQFTFVHQYDVAEMRAKERFDERVAVVDDIIIRADQALADFGFAPCAKIFPEGRGGRLRSFALLRDCSDEEAQRLEYQALFRIVEEIEPGKELCVSPQARLLSDSASDVWNALRRPFRFQEGLWSRWSECPLLPTEDETAESWAERVAISAEDLELRLTNSKRLNYNLDLCAKVFRGVESASTRWLVEGMIPFDAVTLLVGPGGVGKSTILQELLAVSSARTGPKEFLGQPVSPASHACAYLTSENPDWIVDDRRKAHLKPWPDHQFHIFWEPGSSALKKTLRMLEDFPKNSLVVIDPMSMYAEGDLTKDHTANEFYRPLIEFAQDKSSAVVVAHHLVKNAPRCLAHMLPSVKGAGSHTERVRMVIGAIDRGGGNIGIGCLKTNVGSWRPVNEEQLFHRDPETQRLLPIGGRRDEDVDQVLTARIVAAVKRLNREGKRVRRTGRLSLFKMGQPELVGVTRAQIDVCVAKLIETHILLDTEDGLTHSNE